ncbi:MAG TPA: dihydrofolate reductase family protein [Chloroflexota bacterium]|nr:dihydrofolate reductase family protein [Chloroflexota bacterium]
MARLIYSAIASLDGYVADADGSFDWAAPDEEVHAFVNDLERPIGAYLYGRRMYEVMVAWETLPAVAGRPPVVVGGGRPALPRDVRLGLELLGERRFGNGVVHRRYRIRA